MGALDLVGWPAERTLRITGAPASLRVPITLSNASDSMLGSGEIARLELTNAAGQTLPIQAVGTVPAIAAGGVAPVRLRVRLDPTTPPGSYTGQLSVAGVTRPVQIHVVEEVALILRPAPLVIDLAAGLTQRATLSVENRGNVALTIDLAGEYPLGEEAPLLAGSDAAPPASGLGKLLALLPPSTPHGRPLREIGAIGLAMPDGGTRLEPGDTAHVALDLTLPEGLATTARYRAFVPVYDADVAIVLVTAAKSKVPRPKSKGETR